MKTALLGFFGDYESAEVARAQLLVSGFPIDRITLTAMQGAGQSRIRTTPAARDNLLTTLRSLFNHDPSRAERLADRAERGAATVSAFAHNGAAAKQVVAVLEDCGAMEIVRNTRCRVVDRAPVPADHEAAWPSYVWPAT
jgi:hypothetical protein